MTSSNISHIDLNIKTSLFLSYTHTHLSLLLLYCWPYSLGGEIKPVLKQKHNHSTYYIHLRSFKHWRSLFQIQIC